MSKPLISIIAAIGKNGELGKNNKLIFHIPEDLKRFRELTAGHPVIMGRKTYQSIGKPLPGRTNIVVTRDENFIPDGCVTVHSVEDALKKAREIEKEEIFIIGGGEIYKEGLKFTDKLYLTLVEGSFEADTFFPEYSSFNKIVGKKEGTAGLYRYTFLDLMRS